MSAPEAIGRLRHRLTLETAIDAADDNGGVARAFAPGAAFWASIKPLRLERRFEAAREEQAATHHIVFRAREHFDASARFRLGDRVFRVLAVEDVEGLARYQRALCEEIKP